MSKKPGDWWDKSWSVVTGCTPVGAGCDSCWAAALVRRFPAAHGLANGAPAGFDHVGTHPDRLDIPLRARKPRVYAVSLLGDLFHEEVPYDFVAGMDGVLDTAWLANFDRCTKVPVKEPHTFVLLTKRYRRAAEIFRMWYEDGNSDSYTQSSFILLASVWDQASTDAACAAFAGLPVRWGLHMEPLLGAVTLPTRMGTCSGCEQTGVDEYGDAEVDCPGHEYLDGEPSWIVVGSENGPGARPFDLQWARDIQAQCAAAGVPYWFKGAYKQQVPDEMVVREVPW